MEIRLEYVGIYWIHLAQESVGFLAITEIADLTNNARKSVQNVHDSNLDLDTKYPV